MSWFTSLFSSDSSRRKNQAMSSTHEAFSLPTSSPVFPNHSDALRGDIPYTPEPDSASSPYTYPPPSAGSIYDYLPSSAGGSRSRPASLLPMHNKSLSPLPPYPPLAQTWHRLQNWLSNEYPELGDTLNYGILPQDLAQIEMQFGFELPAPIRESYLACDGQEPESAAGCSEGLFFGLTLLPLEEVLEEWRFWRDVDDDPTTGANPKLREAMHSVPPGYVRKEYSSKGWIPLVTDKAGNYLGVDLNPAESGAIGQVIIFGRDFDTKVVIWRGEGPGGWAKWLSSFVEELESGEGYELGTANDGSEGSEDDIGYESYFYGGSGRGQGDGGGDAGPGGLRLTGEYRGWSVLEAWADRSVRKWLESGQVTEEILFPSEKGKRRESIVELVDGVSKQSDAEVPIPVLADIDEKPELGSLGNAADAAKQPVAPRPPLPTISVTKPPAPLPVVLPTQDDLSSPSSPDSTPSSPRDDDLESGMIMKEELPPRQPMSRTQTSSSPPSVGAVNGTTEASLVPLPTSSSASSSAGSSASTPAAQTAGMSDITDLLTEPAPALDAKPIEPVSSSPIKSPVSEPLPNAFVPDAPEANQEPSADDDGKDETTTIRLVGGGGISGASGDLPLVNGDVQVDSEAGGAELASVTSRSSESSTSSNPKGHTKKKSITSGLKKIGKASGGKRKKDSASSIQDAV